jgi:hypothetical protein
MNEIIVGLITLGIVAICVVIRLHETRLHFVIPKEPSADERRENMSVVVMWLGYNDSYVFQRNPKIKLILNEPKRDYESGMYEVHIPKEGITFKGFMCKDQKTIIEY